jgi:hypothetical protein
MDANIANQHARYGKMNGFTDDQIIELRKELQAGIVKPMFWPNCTTHTASNGQIGPDSLSAFHAAGYTKENLVDLIVAMELLPSPIFFTT